MSDQSAASAAKASSGQDGPGPDQELPTNDSPKEPPAAGSPDSPMSTPAAADVRAGVDADHRPRIGDSRPARPQPSIPAPADPAAAVTPGRSRQGGQNLRRGAQAADTDPSIEVPDPDDKPARQAPQRTPRAASSLDGRSASAPARGRAVAEAEDSEAEDSEATERLDRDPDLNSPDVNSPDLRDTERTVSKQAGRTRRRSGRERRGKPVGRYVMCVHVRAHATQIAVLEGRSLVEHFVSRASDDTSQIDGNIYMGRVQNVLPGMEAAFIDIATPKNAVLYRGDVRYDREDIETQHANALRIEQMLRPGQMIVCQVTKNPIGAKGARLTQEVSLPGRFVVMVPNSSAFGISKRLEDPERRRLRRIVDEIRPTGHGLIVRTAAQGASLEELRHDVERLAALCKVIEAEAAKATVPKLLYREPDLGVRIVREELNNDYRAVIIDDPDLFDQVRDYVAGVNPELVDRIEHYDTEVEPLPLFERYHVHEQLHKALDRKVWLPSGGSLIIERTEALTVIDVNTGKNVGTSNLEETVYRNNLEAAEEIARQLRLRDIGGIIVIDFIDMEIRENRDKVGSALRAALARDKTRTQVYEISELGLVEMTRKRVSEGLVESLSTTCTVCGGRGIMLDESLL